MPPGPLGGLVKSISAAQVRGLSVQNNQVACDVDPWCACLRERLRVLRRRPQTLDSEPMQVKGMLEDLQAEATRVWPSASHHIPYILNAECEL